ncbi:DUF3008 family protein [Burkholderia metallica]|uniref:DUF3008 family protein n=1 Tax=Burkholderia metallica TaxID=488729 RepID=UPI001CF105AA|nr:DUF3008 family protein [Burkholderia metallica]
MAIVRASRSSHRRAPAAGVPPCRAGSHAVLQAVLQTGSRARRHAPGIALPGGHDPVAIRDLGPPAKSVAGSMSEQAFDKTEFTTRLGNPEHKPDA